MATVEYDILGSKDNPIELKAHITAVKSLKGNVNIPKGYTEPILEDLTITPSFETQTFTPTGENTYYENVTCEPISITTSEATATPTEQTQEIYPDENEYFNKVTVNPIPDEYVIPTGNLDITENGTYNVKNYETVGIDVSSKPLPAEYQEVEYIESTGTQYINTNYYCNSKTEFDFKITYGTTRGVVFGAYNNGWSTGYGLYHNNNNGDTEWMHYYNNYNTNYKGSENTTQIIDLNKGTVYINNQFTFMTAPKEFFIKQPTYILAGNWAGQRAEQPLSAKIHYFKIKENGCTAMNLIPCYRKLDGIAGLYDIVNQTFYTNAGTGDFIKGPDVT